MPSPDRPFPLVTLEEFFEGNDDYGSIGCNLTPMLGPGYFFEVLKNIRSRPSVQTILVEVIDVEPDLPSVWPFSDRVYIFTDAALDEVEQWATPLTPDAIGEGFSNGKHSRAPEMMSGFKCYSLWWD